MLIMLHAINHNHFNNRVSISHVFRYTHFHATFFFFFFFVNIVASILHSTHIETFQKVPKEFVPKYIWPFNVKRSIVSTTVDVLRTTKHKFVLLYQREFKIISYGFKCKQNKKLTKYLLSYSFFCFFFFVFIYKTNKSFTRYKGFHFCSTLKCLY